MKNLSQLKRHCAAITAGLMVAASIVAPACAFTDPNAGAAQSTEVTIQSLATSDGQTTSDENLTFSTPTVIPFSANAAGVMTGPSATATQIINKSIFPVHVTKMAVAQQDPFHIVDDVSSSDTLKSICFASTPPHRVKSEMKEADPAQVANRLRGRCGFQVQRPGLQPRPYFLLRQSRTPPAGGVRRLFNSSLSNMGIYLPCWDD